MGQFIHIRSDKFPILPGEEEEVANEGMYGKALAEYLESKLTEQGYEVPFVCAEDWGWWVELKNAPFRLGICIYAVPDTNDPTDFVCTDSTAGSRKWSWGKFRFVDTASWVTKLNNDLIAVFESDEDVEIVEVSDEFPL